jgi:hypothetical protein
MGGACSTHVREEKCIQILVEKLKVRDYSENLGVGESIILK